MKQYVKVLSLFLILLLSGCSINYDIEFNDNILSENVNVILNGSDYNLNSIKNLKGFELYAISSGMEQELYEVEYKDTGSEFIANYKYDFGISSFNKSHALKSCYDAFAFTEGEDYYLLSTSKIFKCLLIDYAIIDDVQIRIKTNHKVLENNADYIEDNIYIWSIPNPQKLASVNKPLLIKFSKNTFKDDSLFNNNTFVIALFIIAIALIGGIIFGVAYMKNKNNNR